MKYSQHPKSGLCGFRMVTNRMVFMSGYRMVRFSDARSYKIGLVFKWSRSLDRFINKSVIKNILFVTISLGPFEIWTNRCGFPMVWRPCCFSHLKSRKKCPDNTSLDRFTNKKCHKKYFFHDKML